MLSSSVIHPEDFCIKNTKREREKEKEKETETNTEKQSDTHTHTHTHTRCERREGYEEKGMVVVAISI